MSIKVKYNLFSFFYYLMTVCLGGFIAFFLQYKGVSNTQIGIITGTACIAAIFLTPMISMKVSKSQFLDAKKAIFYAYIAITGCYVILAFFPFPPLIVTVVYMVIYALYLSMSPLLQVMASDYIQAGQDVNFGLARGLGSVAWALGALILGFLVNISHPNLLVIAMTIFTLITFKILSQMSYKKVVVTNRKKK